MEPKDYTTEVNMTQEDKELLLKDLCARLPYGGVTVLDSSCGVVNIIGYDGEDFIDDVRYYHSPEDIKPYLFPLSSMTNAQYEEFVLTSGWDVDIEDVRRGKFSCIGYIGLDYIYDAIDWLNKNHFDYRGLIPKGLAIDATVSKINNENMIIECHDCHEVINVTEDDIVDGWCVICPCCGEKISIIL